MTNSKDPKSTTIQVSSLIPDANPPVEAQAHAIPMALASDEELNLAHLNTLDLTFPAHIRDAYNAMNWKLKWVRYIKNGEYDHENMSKYLNVLGGRFVPIDELRSVDPLYAATLNQASVKAPMAPKAQTIVTKGYDLTLVAYKKSIANKRIEANHKATQAALNQAERSAAAKGLEIKEFTDRDID